MNQDDELATRFDEFRDQAMAATVPAGSQDVRQRARRRRRAQTLAVSSVTLGVLVVAGGTWLGLHRVSPGQQVAAPAGTPTSASSTVASPGSSAAPSGAPSGAPAGGGSGPHCRTGDLTASLQASNGGGAAGSVYLDLGLTNKSSQSCPVYGFPGMTLVDASGKWLPTTVERDPVQPTKVLLAPGQTAWAIVRYTHIPTDGESYPCQPAAVGLAVTPPDETTQLTVHAKLDDVCQKGQLDTSPFTAKRGTS
jgi:hypothetical protein